MPRVWPISDVTLLRHQIVVTLASWRPLSSSLGGRRLVDTLVAEQCPGDASRLIGHGDQDNVCRPPLQEPVGPAGTRARLGAAPAQHRSRTMHEQAPDVAIPAPRYPPQPVLAATRVLPGHETEPGRELSARSELRAISDRRNQRGRCDDTDAGDRRKTAARRGGAVPCQKRRLQLLDPGLGRTQLLNQPRHSLPSASRARGGTRVSPGSSMVTFVSGSDTNKVW